MDTGDYSEIRESVPEPTVGEKLGGVFKSNLWLVYAISLTCIALSWLIFMIVSFAAMSFVAAVLSIVFSSISAVAAWKIYASKGDLSGNLRNLRMFSSFMFVIDIIICVAFGLLTLDMTFVLAFLGNDFFEKLGDVITEAGQEIPQEFEQINEFWNTLGPIFLVIFLVIMVVAIVLCVMSIIMYSRSKKYLIELSDKTYGHEKALTVPPVKLLYVFGVIVALFGVTELISGSASSVIVIFRGVFLFTQGMVFNEIKKALD